MSADGGIARAFERVPPAGVSARWALAHVSGLVLVLLWAIYFGLSLWISPVVASGAAVKTAADTGRITDIDRVSALPPRLSFSPMFRFWEDRSTDGTGRYLLWSTSDGHRYYTEVSTVPGPFPPAVEPIKGPMYSGDGSKPTDEDRATFYVANTTMSRGTGTGWTDAAKLALLFAAVASLIARTPQRGTRWFWFWVITIPLGAGLLWYALSEQLQDHDPGKRRWTGVQGIVFSLIGLAVLSATATVAGQLFIRI